MTSRERKDSDGVYPREPDRDRGRYKSNGRGRPRERPRGGGGGGGRGRHGDVIGSGPMRPVILSRQARAEPAPGTVHIMQRESSGSHISSSPPLKGAPSPGLLPTPSDTLPPSPHQPTPSMIKPRYDKEDAKFRLQRKPESLSSNPSSYTPLQPSGRGMRDRDQGRPDHSIFLGQSNEQSHSVKLVDKGWHWEDKGMEYLLEQSDFLVVGVLGCQGVGKSTAMSLLAGTRTGSGKPYMFRTQSKEVHESGGYQTTGIDMVVTAERVILLDTQPLLSKTMLEQMVQSESVVPPGLSPETYVELLSIQLSLFLYTVCHVIVVVIDNVDSSDMLFRMLWTVEQMKPNVLKMPLDIPVEMGDKHYFPQLVFFLNHATADDFQPLALRDVHCFIADQFHGSKCNLSGGVSLGRSGTVPIGKGFPQKKASDPEEVAPGMVNLQLMVSMPSGGGESYGAFCTSRPEKLENGLNPVFSLLPTYTGHPSFQVLAETFRNQIFSMPRPSVRRAAQQQLSEREWFDYARRVWMTLKKADLISEYEHILQTTPPD